MSQHVCRRFSVLRALLTSSTKKPDFKTVEASRPEFEHDVQWHFTKTVHPNWKPGTGAINEEWKKHKKISFDPYSENRSPISNYKLLINGVSPRPVAFVSTVGKDGRKNLAPFSFFQIVSSDPPIFVIGIVTQNGELKDTAKNILETEELTINIISDWFIDAANYTSIDAPNDIDEWKLSGLTPAASEIVKAEHVAESAFSIEAKLVHTHEWKSKVSGKVTGNLFIVEGVKFHAREDVINENLDVIDIAKLKPVSRLGGITYGRVTQGFELPRAVFAAESEKPEVKDILEK